MVPKGQISSKSVSSHIKSIVKLANFSLPRKFENPQFDGNKRDLLLIKGLVPWNMVTSQKKTLLVTNKMNDKQIIDKNRKFIVNNAKLKIVKKSLKINKLLNYEIACETDCCFKQNHQTAQLHFLHFEFEIS